MSKEIDFPISELYKQIFFGLILVVVVGCGGSEVLYEKNSYSTYQISLATYCISFLVCVAALAFMFKNNLESRLPNYLAITIAFSTVFFIFIPVNIFFIALVSPPVPLSIGGGLGVFAVAYILLSIKKSISIVENCPAVINLPNTGFVEHGGKIILKKKALNKIDKTIKKYPFKFIEIIAAALPLLIFAGLAMVGGVYKLTPNPDLAVRFFCAAIAFLISPSLILMMVYGFYISYILPKRIFGIRWKQIWREIE